jgi:hypothetical protein
MEDLGVTKKDDLDKNETESVNAISIDEEMAILERELTPVEISLDSIKSKGIKIRETKPRKKTKKKNPNRKKTRKRNQGKSNQSKKYQYGK